MILVLLLCSFSLIIVTIEENIQKTKKKKKKEDIPNKLIDLVSFVFYLDQLIRLKNISSISIHEIIYLTTKNYRLTGLKRTFNTIVYTV